MLNHAQRLALLQGRRNQGCLFSTLPLELIKLICSFAHDETPFNIALRHAAFGELKSLQLILEAVKKDKDKVLLEEYLCNRGQTVTRAGVTLKGTSLLECAILSGDREMVAMIKPYFFEIENGHEALEKQLAHCRPCINQIMTTPSEDFTELFDVIKQASDQDVAEELKTGEEYNKHYQSVLRDALDQWRQAKLEPINRVINVLKEPRMHCNYQNWIQVNVSLQTELKKNQWADFIEGENHNKVLLILYQIRGFIELTEFPAVERFGFARMQIENQPASLDRPLEYKHQENKKVKDLFPDFDPASLDSHRGLGFDACLNIKGRKLCAAFWLLKPFQDLCQAKTTQLQNLCSPQRQSKLLIIS